MFLLILVAFIAGIVTILSPCILPILPIILSTSANDDRRRPYGIILSFTFFTLSLTTLVRLLGISPDFLRWIAIGVVGVLGASLLLPQLQTWLEIMFSRLGRFLPNNADKSGLVGEQLRSVLLDHYQQVFRKNSSILPKLPE